MRTRGPPSQGPLTGSNGYHCALPTPTNVTELERALSITLIRYLSHPSPIVLSAVPT